MGYTSIGLLLEYIDYVYSVALKEDPSDNSALMELRAELENSLCADTYHNRS